METIAQKELRSQDQLVKLEQKDLEHYLEHIDPEKFWEDFGRRIKEGIRITLEQTIRYEFQQFIGALEYERSPERRDVRNGHRSRDFGTVYGIIEDIKIPRARNSSFTTWLAPRFKRRLGRLDFLLGGRESQVSWENLLLRLRNRGLRNLFPRCESSAMYDP